MPKIARRLPNPASPTMPYAQAQDYLRAHFAEDISLEQLARLVYLSPFHLSRLFREQLSFASAYLP